MDLENRSIDDATPKSVLSAVALVLRATHHTKLQAIPEQVAFGRDMIANTTYLTNWRTINARKNQSILYNNTKEILKRVQYDYQPGQQAYVINNDMIFQYLHNQQTELRMFSLVGKSMVCPVLLGEKLQLNNTTMKF